MNNQDAVRTQSFEVAKHGKTYYVGLVSDGCSGLPAFTRSEVASNLLTTFCMGRIQLLITSGVGIAEIPKVLYQLAFDYMQNVARFTMPSGVHWPYGLSFKGNHQFRNRLDANQRFIVDYLAATLAGFIDDGERLVTFRADDGVMVIDGQVFVVDQNNEPGYLALDPCGSFDVQVFDSSTVGRLTMATDGLKELIGEEADQELLAELFTHNHASLMGLQYKLNLLRKNHADKMGDDCSVITRERLEVPS